MPAGDLSLLDNIRYSNGPKGLREYYRSQLRNDRAKALELINDRNLRFSTLYLLRGELYDSVEPAALNPLYYRALEVAGKLTDKNPKDAEKELRAADDGTLSALRWIVRTGYTEIDPDENYKGLLENAAAMLTKTFRDTSALPEIAEMIFAENRNGGLIHELVWAFFEARSPRSLYLIANYLNSPHIEDVELARKLLCFIPDIGSPPGVSGPAVYNRVMYWLQENLPFLYYTGESLHLCNSPRHYAVAWSAKYLCRPVSAENGEPLLPLNSFEKKLASGFNKRSEPARIQLADFSQMLHRRNVWQWNTWIRLPAEEQARLAARAAGGLL